MNRLTSETISALRLPLAVMVVFIHSFSSSEKYAVNWSYFDGMDAYNTLRILCSHVVSHVAVPLFFIISGYLFFIKTERLDWSFYRSQWSKRISTLLIPYILWNLMFILWNVMLKVAVIVVKGMSPSSLLDYLHSVCTLRIFWDFNSWGGWKETVFHQITKPNIGPILTPMWFIRDLIIVVALTPILAWLLKRIGWALLIVLGFIYIFNVQTFIPNLPVTALLFFCVGAYLALNKKQLIGSVCRRIVPYAMLCWLSLIIFSVRYDGRNTVEGMLLYPFMVIVGVWAMTLLVASIVNKRIKCDVQAQRHGRLSSIYNYVAQNTFFIYAAHAFFGFFIAQFVLDKIFTHLSHSPLILSVRFLAFPFVTVIACLLALRMLQCIIPGLARLLTGKGLKK